MVSCAYEWMWFKIKWVWFELTRRRGGVAAHTRQPVGLRGEPPRGRPGQTLGSAGSQAPERGGRRGGGGRGGRRGGGGESGAAQWPGCSGGVAQERAEENGPSALRPSPKRKGPLSPPHSPPPHSPHPHSQSVPVLVRQTTLRHSPTLLSL